MEDKGGAKLVRLKGSKAQLDARRLLTDKAYVSLFLNAFARDLEQAAKTTTGKVYVRIDYPIKRQPKV